MHLWFVMPLKAGCHQPYNARGPRSCSDCELASYCHHCFGKIMSEWTDPVQDPPLPPEKSLFTSVGAFYCRFGHSWGSMSQYSETGNVIFVTMQSDVSSLFLLAVWQRRWSERETSERSTQEWLLRHSLSDWLAFSLWPSHSQTFVSFGIVLMGLLYTTISAYLSINVTVIVSSFGDTNHPVKIWYHSVIKVSLCWSSILF